MKNLIFLIFVSLIFIGCAGKNSQSVGIIKTSAPIFISEFPVEKTAFVNFTNTSEMDANLTEAVEFDLQKNGYEIVSENLANFVIKGNINYFRRVIVKDENPFFGSIGFGFGFGGFRHAGIGIGTRFPFGYLNDDDYDYRTNSYIYDGQVSLLIRVKSGKTYKDYATNLNYQTGRNLNGPTSIKQKFNEKISQTILQILNH